MVRGRSRTRSILNCTSRERERHLQVHLLDLKESADVGVLFRINNLHPTNIRFPRHCCGNSQEEIPRQLYECPRSVAKSSIPRPACASTPLIGSNL